jgi:hypothetical protein
MTSEPIRMELSYDRGHRNRHTPHLCPDCHAPLTSDGRCTHCAAEPVSPREHPFERFPNRRVRLERMERAARPVTLP